MSHPSYGEQDPDEESFESVIPFGATPDQVGALVDAVVGEIEKLGLYPRHANLAVSEAEDGNEENCMMIHAIFTFGKVAFTPRVQDPEQDKFDDSFRSIETEDVAEQAKAIIERFRRGSKKND